MARPRFSEMLVNRRRQLGLSISQASEVLRLKEQVLIAFEEGDFDRIPKTGYAQGMLASYARYLGLNSRVVVNQFQDDLYEYANDPLRQRRAVDDGSAAVRGYSGTDAGPYVESRGLLPTSGGLAGDMGAFSTTSQPHSRSQSSPLVTQRRYVGTAGRSEESAADDMRGRTGQMRATTRYADTAYDGRSHRGYGSDTYGRDQVTTRRVASQYDDEYDYDDGAYQATSGRDGSTRTRNRRSTSSARQTAPGRSGGLVGKAIEFLSVGRRGLVLLVLALAAILTAITIVSVRSCVSSHTPQETGTVPVSTAEPVDPSATSSTTESTKTDAEKEDAAQTEGEDATSTTSTSTSKTPTAKQTRVVVSVESGMVSWVEIVCDGENVIAYTVTGPWSQTFDVHESIVIEVSDPTAVTVTENGTRRQFDTKTSGIGSITIQGTPEVATTETKKDEDTDKESEDTEAETETETEGASSKQDADYGDDEFYTEYNGYDIYYNAESDLYYFIDENGVKRNAANGAAI